MRADGIERIAFSSTGSVYGEPEVFPTPEDAPFPVQTSLYAASKLASEGAHPRLLPRLRLHAASIFRFVSILGERYTHGHVIDFYRRLAATRRGCACSATGARRSPTSTCSDCVPAMLTGDRRHAGPGHDRRLQPRHRRDGDRRRVGRHRSPSTSASQPEIEHTGGDARLARRLAAHPSRLHAGCARSDGRPTLTIAQAIDAHARPGSRPIARVLEEARDERHLHPGAAANLARRRRHRPPVVLRASTAASCRRRDRQVRLHAHAHGFPAAVPDEVHRRSRRSTPAEIRHPILREALLRHWRGDPLEIASVADVPAGTGMGSSGAFTVCLLKALALARRHGDRPAALAEAACEIEIDILSEPVGKQDTYVAAHGGICAYTFHPRRDRRRRAAGARRETRCRSCATTCCSSSPASRARGLGVLATRTSAPRRGDEQMLREPPPHEGDGLRVRDLLLAGDLEALRGADARALGEQAPRSPGMATEQHRRRSTRSPAAAARSAGKLVGAGGGGFLLVYATRPGRHAPGDGGAQARRSSPFDFEFHGASATELPMSTRPLRVGIVGCGLDRAQAGRGARPGDEPRRVLRHRRRTPRERLPTTHGGLVCADARRAARRSTPTSWSSRRPHDQLAPLAEPRAARPAPTCSSRSRPGSARPQVDSDRRRRRAHGTLVQGRVSTTASTRRSRAPRPRSARAGHGDVHVPARALRPRRPARLRPRVARGPGALRRRRARRPGHAPARPRPLARAGRCRCTPRCCARSSGTRRSRTTPRSCSASRPTRTRPGRCCTSSWTEWKNTVLARDLLPHREAPGRRPRALVRPPDATRLPHEAGARARPTLEELDFPAEDVSWRGEWAALRDAVAARRRCAATLGRRALRVGIVEDAYARLSVRADAGRVMRVSACARHRRLDGHRARGRPGLAAQRTVLVLVAARGRQLRGGRDSLPGAATVAHVLDVSDEARGPALTVDRAPTALVLRGGRDGPDRIARRRTRRPNSARTLEINLSARCSPCTTACPACARPAARSSRSPAAARRRRCRASTPTPPPRPRSRA